MPDGQTVSSPIAIQQEFVRIWVAKVFKKDRCKPNWPEFKAEFAEFVPFAQYEGGAPHGQVHYYLVRNMGMTLLGLDGWRVKELQGHPKEAWQQRAIVLEVQLRTGGVPNVKYLYQALEHRGLAIFSVLWRAESADC